MAEVDDARGERTTISNLLPARDALRVIAHIDMDAFYAQIEQVRDPSLTGKPVAVVQYPTTMHDIKDMAPDDNRIVEGSASSIIAVSYEARAFGVKRNMKGGEARKACAELSLVQVPNRNGKADISLYRKNGEMVVEVLERTAGASVAVEKASIDEVYVDVTRAAKTLMNALVLSDLEGVDRHDSSPSSSHQKQQQQQQQPQQKEEGKTCAGEGWEDIGAGGWARVVFEAAGTHIAGLEDDPSDHAEGFSWWARPPDEFSREEMLLACGAAVVSRLRGAVKSQLKFSCTAGVAHNKLLAKLCSNMHKPNAQTILPGDMVPRVFRELPVERVRGWGGKFGVRIMETLGVSTAGEVADKGQSALQRAFGEQDGWRVWQKSQGIDLEHVKPRSAPKSIGCSKTFPGRSKIMGMTLIDVWPAIRNSQDEAERWLSELSKELVDRLDHHKQSEGQIPTKLTASFNEVQDGKERHASRCCRVPKRIEVSCVVEACMRLIRGYNTQAPTFTMLGVSAHTFEDTGGKDTRRIDSFFSSGGAKSALTVAEEAQATRSAQAGGGEKEEEGEVIDASVGCHAATAHSTSTPRKPPSLFSQLFGESSTRCDGKKKRPSPSPSPSSLSGSGWVGLGLDEGDVLVEGKRPRRLGLGGAEEGRRSEGCCDEGRGEKGKCHHGDRSDRGAVESESGVVVAGGRRTDYVGGPGDLGENGDGGRGDGVGGMLGSASVPASEASSSARLEGVYTSTYCSTNRALSPAARTTGGDGGHAQGVGGMQATEGNVCDAPRGGRDGERVTEEVATEAILDDVAASDDSDAGDGADREATERSGWAVRETLEGRARTGGERRASSRAALESRSVVASSDGADGAAAFGMVGVVDLEVLKELPLDIQREIRTQLQQARGGHRAARVGTSAPPGGRRGGSRRAGARRERGQATISSFFGSPENGRK